MTTVLQYCADESHTLESLADVKKLITWNMEERAAQLAKCSNEYSAITAAIRLKAYSLKPGDHITWGGLRRVLILNESQGGAILGQPVNDLGQPQGRMVTINDYALSKALKLDK